MTRVGNLGEQFAIKIIDDFLNIKSSMDYAHDVERTMDSKTSIHRHRRRGAQGCGGIFLLPQFSVGRHFRASSGYAFDVFVALIQSFNNCIKMLPRPIKNKK